MMLIDERYKELMEQVGLPNSRSVLQALKQAAMEGAVLAKASQQVQVDADNQLLSMGMDKPVSMYRAVSKLIQAADILLKQKNYDGTGHELITEARNQAASYLRAFRPVPAPKQELFVWGLFWTHGPEPILDGTHQTEIEAIEAGRRAGGDFKVMPLYLSPAQAAAIP